VEALVHGFFERLEHLGSVLGFVTFEGALVFFFILVGVGDVDGEVGRVGSVEWKERRPDGVEGLRLIGREAGIVELDARGQGLDDFSDGVGDEAMIGMAVAAVRSPGDDDLGVELVDEFSDVVSDSMNVFSERIGHGAEFAVVEIEKDGRLNAEFLAGASSFGATRGGERRSGGNFGESVDAFFAFGSDGEIDLDAFASVTGEDGAHEGFVVGVSEDGEEDARLGRRSLRL